MDRTSEYRGLRLHSVFLALLLFAGGLIAPALGEEKDAPEEESQETVSREEAFSLITVSEMVRRGHIYLSRVQNTDGSFSLDRESPAHYKSAPIAVTSLACLSFMAGGNTPDSGLHHKALRKGLIYLIDICEKETGIFHDDLDQTSKMHGQGFAILAIAQAYGMYGLKDRSQSLSRERMKKALHTAVTLVCDIQTDVGGWYYEPTFSSDHEGSITICVVQALRAARNAGVHVDKGVIDRAVDYVRRSQKKDGSFRYRLNDDTSSYSLTAAGIATLNATGEYDSEAIDRGLEFMLKRDPILNLISLENYPNYARYYAAQAYYQYHDLSHWLRWYPRLVDQCRELQYPDGSFPNSRYGSVYATAMTTLTLQVPFGYLPIFQR